MKLKWCFTTQHEQPFRGLFSTAEMFTKKNLRVHNHHSSRTLWRTSGSLSAQPACTHTNTCTHTHLGFCTLTNEIQSQASVFLISCYFAQFSKLLAVYLVRRHTAISFKRFPKVDFNLVIISGILMTCFFLFFVFIFFPMLAWQIKETWGEGFDFV